MKTKIALFALLVLGSSNAWSQTKTSSQPTPPAPAAQTSATHGAASDKPAIDPAKEKDIRRLLEVAGTKDLMASVMDGMAQNVKPILQNSLPPGDYRDKLIDAFIVKFRSKLGLSQLLDLAVPLYEQNYSDSEIKSLIAFYETPLGQKVVRVTPAMPSEMMARGQKLGEEVGRTSMLEVIAEHPEFQKAMEEAQQNAGPPPAKP